MQKIAILLSLLMLITSLPVYAKTGPFYFAGGTVPPKLPNSKQPGGFHVIVPYGMHDAGMRISCDIENPNYNQPYPVVVRIQQTQFVTLNHEITHIAVSHKHINGEGDAFPVYIENFDDTDAVYVKNCISSY